MAVQAQSATGREKAALEARAQKAKTKLDAAKEKADAVERAPLPKVEVRQSFAVGDAKQQFYTYKVHTYRQTCLIGMYACNDAWAMCFLVGFSL